MGKREVFLSCTVDGHLGPPSTFVPPDDRRVFPTAPYCALVAGDIRDDTCMTAAEEAVWVDALIVENGDLRRGVTEIEAQRREGLLDGEDAIVWGDATSEGGLGHEQGSGHRVMLG